MKQGTCIVWAAAAILSASAAEAATSVETPASTASAASDEVDYTYRVSPVHKGTRFVYLAYDVLAERFSIRAITQAPIRAGTTNRLPAMELLVVSADGHQIQPLYRNYEYEYRRDPNDLLDTPAERVVTSFECSGEDAIKARQGIHDLKQGVVADPCLSRLTKAINPGWMATPSNRASFVLDVGAIRTAVTETDLIAQLSQSGGKDFEVPSDATPATPQPAWLLHWNDGSRAVFKLTQWQIAGSVSPTGGELLWRHKRTLAQDVYQANADLRKVLLATSVGQYACTQYSYQKRDSSSDSFSDCDGLSPLFVKAPAGMMQVECVFGEYFPLDAGNDARYALDERICLGGRDDSRRGGQPGGLPRRLTEIDILTADETAALDVQLAKARHVRRNR